jgi:hypothetical protein
VRLVIDLGALQVVLSALTGWLDRQEREAVGTSLRRTVSCGVSSVDVGCVSQMTIAVGWPRERIELAAQACGT